MEVEFTRTEHVEFIHDDDDGMNDAWDSNSPRVVGSFLRLLQFHMHDGKYVTVSGREGDADKGVRGETPRLLSFRFAAQDCQGPDVPDPTRHRGPWERIPGSDQASRCTACGGVSGK